MIQWPLMLSQVNTSCSVWQCAGSMHAWVVFLEHFLSSLWWSLDMTGKALTKIKMDNLMAGDEILVVLNTGTA